MANVNVTVVTTPQPNVASSAFTATALSANDVAIIPMGKDEQMTFVASNAGNASLNLTIKAGDSLQAVNDEVIAVAAGKSVAFSLDSGRFKHLTGNNKGCVTIIPSAACTITVIETRV